MANFPNQVFEGNPIRFRFGTDETTFAGGFEDAGAVAFEVGFGNAGASLIRGGAEGIVLLVGEHVGVLV